MDTAKLFMTGRSQAVRLPKAYRLEREFKRLPGLRVENWA